MKGAEYEVPCEGGLDGDFSGLQIPDFTDEDHVGVLTQNGSQAGCKGNADVMVDLNLNNSIDVIFDRIFGRDELFGNFVHFRQGRIQRGGLA